MTPREPLPEKLYYSIQEVAAYLQENESALRYWEKEFKNIKPKKNAAGTRFYTKADLAEVELIHHLLREKGLTVAGAKKRLKDNKDLVTRNHEIIQRLRDIRSKVIAIRDEL